MTDFIPAILSGGAGLLGSFIQNRAAQEMNDANWDRQLQLARVNSIAGQYKEWTNLGLNPNAFQANFVPQTASPVQGSSLGSDIARAVHGAAGLLQQRKLAELEADVKREGLEVAQGELDIKKSDLSMRKEMHTYLIAKAQQALEQGNIQLAIDNLNLAYYQATNADRIKVSHNDASISDNQVLQSNEFTNRYPQYLATLIDEKQQHIDSMKHNDSIQDQRLVKDYSDSYDAMTRYWDSSYNKQKDSDRRFDFSLRKQTDYLEQKNLDRYERATRGDFKAFERGQKEYINLGRKFLSLPLRPKRYY